MEKEQGKFDWPKEAILSMIEMWQKYECLYNPKHKFYHNKHSRYAALSEMAENLKTFNPAIGCTEIKNKMSYLRGQYTREIAKMKEKKSGIGADEVYVPSAYWFKELFFLEDFVKIRKGGCNLYTQNSVQPDESGDSSQPIEFDTSPQPTKRPRMMSDTPQSSQMSQEDSVLAAATVALQNIASSSKKPEFNEQDEAFCNFIKTEISEITSANIKDELKEKITLNVFDAKKKQRVRNIEKEEPQ